MGLLDNLQSQVDKIREEENQQNAQLQVQEAYYESHLKPVMIRVHEYFATIIKNLNIVEPEISTSYPLNPVETAGILVKQSDYRFHSDSGRHPHQIDILAHCNFVRPMEFYVPTKHGAANYSDLLESYGFPYHRKNKLDMMYDICGATFHLEGPIEAHIRVSANLAEKCINIFVRNIESNPIKKYRVPPEKVDDDLLERLARLLIREESTLVEVKVCQSVRDEFQLQLEEHKRLEEAAIAKAYAEIQVERQEAEDAKLVNRTKRAIEKGNKKIFELISNMRRSG
jgi:hypothetical protein